ncbi:hypothetical protein [Caulobacter sp. S45]|uniref:hypothetical protein n=1 Tax=Caulobacter sp. S45 TaxID=1641861 RepID=UPI00131E9512|nr:hypothetical protein [Caulobacter sp. S45]
MIVATLLAAIAAVSSATPSSALPMLKFVCTGTQTSSRSDVAGKIQMPWKRSYRINQKTLMACTAVCRGTHVELSAQKVVFRSLDDGRLSQPLTLDRASMNVVGHQVTPLGLKVTLTVDTTGQCAPAA